MTSALEGEGGSRKVDKSTDKLRDHVCDKGGRGSKNSKFSWTSLMEAPYLELWWVSVTELFRVVQLDLTPKN